MGSSEISENFTVELKDVSLVDKMKSKYDDKKIFKNLEYTTKDIEIITKCAYFEYQRNKIYWRTNDKLKKIQVSAFNSLMSSFTNSYLNDLPKR